MAQPSCKDLIQSKFDDQLTDYIIADRYFRNHYDNPETREANRPEDVCESYESFYDYVRQTSLSWDYVDPHTFTDQEEGYWRLQLSFGGPSDEFRVFLKDDKTIGLVFYHFMDWFDGANLKVEDIGKNEVIFRILNDFLELSLFFTES